MAWKALRVAITTVMVLIAGLFGFGVFIFSDLGPGETLLSRLLTAAAFFLLCGLLVGYVNSDVWALSLLLAWAEFLLVPVGLLSQPQGWGELLALLSATALPSVLGGYLGSRLRHILPFWRSRDRLG